MDNDRKYIDIRDSKDVKKVRKCENGQKGEMGPYITDLPIHICIDILSILPFKSVRICCCVCKTWRDLINSSEFVKLFSAQAYPLIHPMGPTLFSRTLYLIDNLPNYKPTKLKIPLSNAEIAMNAEGDVTTNLSQRERITNLNPNDHMLSVLNSCNGYLCLLGLFPWDLYPIWHPVMVCNPITGEFIKLPTKFVVVASINYGFGFCLKTCRYKVIRMFAQKGDNKTNIDPVTNRPSCLCSVAELHILGTNTWKKVGNAPYIPREKCTYLNGTLNWLYLSSNHSTIPYYIASFDIGQERFQSIPVPPKSYHQFSDQDNTRLSVGELRDCLCVCDGTYNGTDTFELWVMKTYGVESSWIIEIKIDMFTVCERWVEGPFKAMSYFKDGTLLLFNSWSGTVFSYAPADKKIEILKLCGMSTSVDRFEVIAYTPSLMSLKDAITGADVEVYNVKSGFGDLELEGESNPIFLEEGTTD